MVRQGYGCENLLGSAVKAKVYVESNILSWWMDHISHMTTACHTSLHGNVVIAKTNIDQNVQNIFNKIVIARRKRWIKKKSC